MVYDAITMYNLQHSAPLIEVPIVHKATTIFPTGNRQIQSGYGIDWVSVGGHSILDSGLSV